MNFLKSLCDGVGTGAGVAWPSFGIISGAIGTAGLVTADVILGSISAGLFLGIVVPICYWSYHQNKKQHAELDSDTKTHEDNLTKTILSYLLTQVRKILFERNCRNLPARHQEVITDLKAKIVADLALPNLASEMELFLNKLLMGNFLSNFIQTLMSDSAIAPDFTVNPSQANITQLENYIKLNCVRSIQFTPSPLNASISFQTKVSSFAGGFGSLAGCSAGSMGLLHTLGFIPTLSCIPFVGWGILASAVVVGILCAIISVSNVKSLDRKIKHIKNFDKINDKVENLVFLHKTETEVRVNAAALEANHAAERAMRARQPIPQIIQLDRSRLQSTKKTGCMNRLCHFFKCPRPRPISGPPLSQTMTRVASYSQ